MASRSKRVQRFTGPLAKPITAKHHRPTLVGLTREQATRKTAEEWVRAMKLSLDKLPLLFTHFGIVKTGSAADDYFALSLRLAREYVPGFQIVDAVAPGRGRPSQHPEVFLHLLCDVEIAKRDMKLGHSRDAESSNAKAIASLTRHPRFARRWARYKGKERTLANMLTRARDVRVNPLYELWRRPGQAGKEARQLLIDEFSITKNAR